MVVVNGYSLAYYYYYFFLSVHPLSLFVSQLVLVYIGLTHFLAKRRNYKIWRIPALRVCHSCVVQDSVPVLASGASGLLKYFSISHVTRPNNY